MKSYEEYYMEFMDSLFNRKKQKSDKESTIRKKSNLIWKIIFIPLFIISLGLVGAWVHVYLNMDSGVIGALILIPFSGILAFIDLIAVLSYIIIRKPQDVDRDISYAVLVPIVLVLIYAVYYLFDAWWNYYH